MKGKVKFQCPECFGSGWHSEGSAEPELFLPLTCLRCGGSGYVWVEDFNTIPPEFDNEEIVKEWLKGHPAPGQTDKLNE